VPDTEAVREAMSSITIELTEERLQRLRELARRAGVSPEELARMGLDELLARPDEKFNAASDYVLNENEELYRRLA
jgi:predicted transcriptional regulator